MDINENKGKSIGGLIGGAIANDSSTETFPENSHPKRPGRPKKSDTDKLKDLASGIQNKVEGDYDNGSQPTKKQRKRKLTADFFNTSARFRKDLYEKMLEHEVKNYVPLVHQYNNAIEYWFANGCPIGLPQNTNTLAS